MYLYRHANGMGVHLALVVVVEGSESPPGGAQGGKLHDTRGKHEPKEQPANQPQG